MAGLLDYLQSASNAAASNVSGPVDLINAGLLAAGLPMPRKPFMGSEWMADRGLTREVNDPYARVIGETAGLVAPTVVAAKAPQIARGLLTMADNAMIPSEAGRSLAMRQTGALTPSGRKNLADILQQFDKSGPSSRTIKDAIELTPTQRDALEQTLREQFGPSISVPSYLPIKPRHAYESRVTKDGFTSGDVARWFEAGAADEAVPIQDRAGRAALRGTDATKGQPPVSVKMTVRGDALGNVYADDVIPEGLFGPKAPRRK